MLTPANILTPFGDLAGPGVVPGASLDLRMYGSGYARRGEVHDSAGGHVFEWRGRPAGEFDGLNAYVSTGTASDALGGASCGVIAVRCIFDGDEPGASEGVAFALWSTSGGSTLGLARMTASSVRIFARSEPSESTLYADIAVSIPRDEWMSFIAGVDLPTRTVHLWKNGEYAGSALLNAVPTQTTFAAQDRVYYAGSLSSTLWRMHGRIASLHIGGTDTLPDADDAQVHHDDAEGWIVGRNYGRGWLFTEGSGSTAAELHGSGDNMVFTSATWNVGANGGNPYRQPNAVRVFGDLTPDATGLYLPAGTHNGVTYYQREDGAYVYYATGLGYKLSAELDASIGPRWYASGTNPTFKALTPYDATGTAYAGLWGDAYQYGGRWCDGTDDYLVRADAGNFGLGTGEFTAAIHVAPEAYNSYPQLIGAGGSGATEWRLANVYSSYNVLSFSAGGQSVQTDLVDDGEPHVIVARRTATNMSIWVDGVSAVSEPRTPGNVTTTAPLRLMAGGAGETPDSSRVMQGRLFGAQMYLRAIRDGEIQTLTANARSG